VGSCKSSEKIPKSPLNCFGSKLVLTPIDAIQNINERKKEKEKKKGESLRRKIRELIQAIKLARTPKLNP
jgi:transcriptional/translational regulatory protein YebC/TACO1